MNLEAAPGRARKRSRLLRFLTGRPGTDTESALDRKNTQIELLRPLPAKDDVDLYSALDSTEKQIRLLRILPGIYGGDQIKCVLELSSLNREPKPVYETISYTWGTSQEVKTINLNDRPISILINAETSLQCVRHEHEDRVVWIDSICINQQDLAERSQQVSMMADIYRLSRGNLVILDGDYCMGNQAFDAVSSVVGLIQQEFGKEDLTRSDILDDKGLYRLPADWAPWNKFADEYSAGHVDIDWLFHSPWFRVIQETVLAPHSRAFCGRASLDLAKILDAAAYFVHRSIQSDRSYPNDLVWPNLNRAYNIWLLSQRHHNRGYVSLQRLFTRTGNFDCADIRDHVFGVLGLWQRQGKSSVDILPDYEQDPAVTLCEATFAAIIEARRLNIIEETTMYHKEVIKGLPSWVRDWYRPVEAEHDATYWSGRYDCSKGRWHDISRSEDGNALICQGASFDHVSQVSEPIRDDKKLNSTLKTIERLVHDAGHGRETLGATLIAAADSSGRLASHSLIRQLDGFLRAEYDGMANSDEDYSDYSRIFWMIADNRRFFVTSSNRIGLGPAEMKHGDRLAVVLGGELVWVLRPASESAFTYVGSAYVHGVMDGEVVDEHTRLGNDFVPIHIV